MDQKGGVIDQKGLAFFSFHEINHEVRQNVRAKLLGNRFLFDFAIHAEMGFVVTRSLAAIAVIHLPKAMFIEAERLDCIIPFQPRDIPFPGDRGGVTCLLQLVGKTVELCRVQIGVIIPLAQHMCDTREARIGARHDFNSRWRACRVGKAMGKQYPVVSQLIKIWCPNTVASIGLERFNSQVVSADQNDVGFIAWQTSRWSSGWLFSWCPGFLLAEDFYPVVMLRLELAESLIFFGRDLTIGVGVDMRE